MIRDILRMLRAFLRIYRVHLSLRDWCPPGSIAMDSYFELSTGTVVVVLTSCTKRAELPILPGYLIGEPLHEALDKVAEYLMTQDAEDELARLAVDPPDAAIARELRRAARAFERGMATVAKGRGERVAE